ncbi:hypothetical protein STEG23_034519 [Scotinomys teguina]
MTTVAAVEWSQQELRSCVCYRGESQRSDPRCSLGNSDHFLAIHQKKNWKPAFIHRHSQDIEKSLEIAQEAYKQNYHSPAEVQISKRHQIVNSAFPRPAYDPSLDLLAVSGQELQIENLPIPAANVIVVVSTKLSGIMLMLTFEVDSDAEVDVNTRADVLFCG